MFLYDNAITESFFATLQYELINRSVFSNHSEARLSTLLCSSFIEVFYDRRWRHSSIDYFAPLAYEGSGSLKGPLSS